MAVNQRQDVISMLKEDHREVERLFGELEGAGDPQQRRILADEVIIELVRHSVAEEMHLYPAVRQFVPNGDEVAEKEIADHAAAEQTMNELDGLDPTDPRFDHLVRELMTQINTHVADEEQNLFPALADGTDRDTLFELGDKVQTAKRMAPTRPHPAAPDRPPLNQLLGPGTALVDRVRDYVTGRGRSQ